MRAKFIYETLNELKVLKGPSEKEIQEAIENIDKVIMYIIENWVDLTGTPKENIALGFIHDKGEFPEIILDIIDQNNFDYSLFYERFSKILEKNVNEDLNVLKGPTKEEIADKIGMDKEELFAPFNLNTAEELLNNFNKSGGRWDPDMYSVVLKNNGDKLFFYVNVGGDVYSIYSLNKKGRLSICSKDFTYYGNDENRNKVIIKWLNDKGWERDQLSWHNVGLDYISMGKISSPTLTFKNNVELYMWLVEDDMPA